jgi:hypothetical protein
MMGRDRAELSAREQLAFRRLKAAMPGRRPPQDAVSASAGVSLYSQNAPKGRLSTPLGTGRLAHGRASHRVSEKCPFRRSELGAVVAAREQVAVTIRPSRARGASAASAPSYGPSRSPATHHKTGPRRRRSGRPPRPVGRPRRRWPPLGPVAARRPGRSTATQGLPQPYPSPWRKTHAIVRQGKNASLPMSPYQFNPLNLNPLREALLASVDFERLRDRSPIKLLLAVTRGSDGRLRILTQRGADGRGCPRVRLPCPSCITRSKSTARPIGTAAMQPIRP